jgi:hypothetical protein
MLVATLFAPILVSGAHPAHFTIRVDVSQVPDAKPYVKPTRELIAEWYPKINAILFGRGRELPLKTIIVIFEPASYAGSGAARSELPAHEEEDTAKSVGRIHINFSYLARVKYPYSATLIHELTHVNEQYKDCPEWLNEGIADYIRHKYFERDIEPKLPSIEAYGIGAKDMDRFRKEGYLAGYTIAGNFLFWMELKKDSGLITALSSALRDGAYSPDLFIKRCGAPLSALWREFISATDQ